VVSSSILILLSFVFSLPNLSRRTLDVYHTSILKTQVWHVLHTACCKCRTQKIAISSPSGHHRTTVLGCIFATEACIDNRKKIVKRQYLPYMSSQYGELQPTNGCDWLGSLGHPINFNEFCVLASLLQWRRSLEANKTLHDVWLSPGLVQIHFWRLLPSDGILPGAKFTLHSSLAFSYIDCITAWHSSSGSQPNFAAWYKEWNYRTFAEGATYIRLGGHHIGHRPTF